MDEVKAEVTSGAETPAVSEPVAQEQAVPQPTYLPEPRHPLQDILDKAAAKKVEQEAKQEPAKEGLAAPQAAPTETWSLDKWDGNPTSLPEKLRKIVTNNQAAFTQKSQEVAQLKQYKDAYEQLQSQIQAQQTSQLEITQEEFEAAQLDPQKFMQLAKKAAAIELSKEKAALQPIIQDLQFKQMTVENQQKISDFATQHPDFWELYDKGLIEPFVKQTGDLEGSYTKAREIADRFKQDVKAEIKQEVQVKKSATSMIPTQAHQVEVVYVRHQSEALEAAARNAMSRKRVKVIVDPNRAV